MKYCPSAGDPSNNRDIIHSDISCIRFPVRRLVLAYYHRRAVDAKYQKFFLPVLKKVLINCKVEERIGGIKVNAKHL